MTVRVPPVLTISVAGAAVLMLAACDRSDQSADTDRTDKSRPAQPLPSEAASDSAKKISILRPDIEVAREPKPLAPLSVRIGFDDGGDVLSAQARRELEDVLVSPQMKAGGAIVLGGHTDSAGNDAANLRASRKRAAAVRDWLVGHGVDPTRITVIAFGEQNPLAPNAKADGTPDEQARARNRRVDLTIAVPPGTPEAAQSGAPETLVDELTAPK